MKCTYSILSLFLLVGVSVGCHSNLPKDLPPLYPCTISVTQDGVPLERAVVALQYAEGAAPAEGQLWFPRGVTDANGEAVLKANSLYPGAPIGHFKIIVTKFVPGESKYGPPPPEDDPRYSGWVQKVSGEIPPVFGIIEKQYTEAETTPHEIEIKKGKNSASIDVGKPTRYLVL